MTTRKRVQPAELFDEDKTIVPKTYRRHKNFASNANTFFFLTKSWGHKVGRETLTITTTRLSVGSRGWSESKDDKL